MWVWHEDDQEEFGHIEELLEGILYSANHTPMLLLNLLLLDLGRCQVHNPRF